MISNQNNLTSSASANDNQGDKDKLKPIMLIRYLFVFGTS